MNKKIFFPPYLNGLKSVIFVILIPLGWLMLIYLMAREPIIIEMIFINVI